MCKVPNCWLWIYKISFEQVDYECSIRYIDAKILLYLEYGHKIKNILLKGVSCQA